MAVAAAERFARAAVLRASTTQGEATVRIGISLGGIILLVIILWLLFG